MYYTLTMAKTQTIRRITSKGQVTLPASWRKRMKNDTVVFMERGTVLEVHPAEVLAGEEVLFDALRDNGGTGLPITDLIHELQKDLAK